MPKAYWITCYREIKDPAKVAAQRAFFDAALGKAPAAAPTQAAPQPSAPTAVSRSAAAPSLAPQASAEPPQKILRPGSLLDIKI